MPTHSVSADLLSEGFFESLTDRSMTEIASREREVADQFRSEGSIVEISDDSSDDASSRIPSVSVVAEDVVEHLGIMLWISHALILTEGREERRDQRTAPT
jgi:hypothetical protein